MLIRRAFSRVAFVAVLAWTGVLPAQAPLVPVTVCEVLADLGSHQGKDYAVVGRYSFREKGGRTLNEQACAAPTGGPLQLRLVETDSGPKPPDSFEIDSYQLSKKFADIQTRTALGKFRFGTPDYDRWVVVYGRLEPPARTDATAAPSLAYRGDGAIIFLTASR
jgi:hypothetical protein